MTSFYPAAGTRSTSQLAITRLLFQVNNDQSSIQSLQEQLSTGYKILKPSDDPGAAIRALAAQRGLEFKEQVGENLQSADTILSATEATLAQVQDVLNTMRGVSVAATGTTLSDEELQAYAQEVQSGIDQLLQLSNSKFRDQFIFAGSDVRETPLQYVGDTVRFHGNEDQLQTITDSSATIAANVTSQDVFGVISNRVIGKVDLNASVVPKTPLADLNRGAGIRTGAITLSDGVDVIELDLTGAYNIEDVVRKLASQQVGGRELAVTVKPTGLDIQYADGLGGLLRIGEVGSGNAASDLGINNINSPGLSPVVGSNLDPVVTETTQLSQLLGGIGIPATDSFLLKQGERSFVIRTDNLNTVEDLLNRIRSSGAAVDVSLDDSGRYLAIKSTESGSTLSIGENGSNLATLLGIRSYDSDTLVSSLNFNEGLSLNEFGDDLVLKRSDGSEFQVNLDGVVTVADVLNRVNNSVENQDPALRITAALASVGNGITLSATAGAEPIAVSNAGGSQAAWGLGLVPLGEVSASGSTVGIQSRIGGSDVSGVEVEGAFNSLLRLRDAIESGRPEDMTRIAEALGRDIQRLSLSRGVVGSRQQNLDVLKDLTADQHIRLTQVESDELDADIAQVISDLTARQAALQASLQLMGQSTRLTLFDYL